MSLKFIYGTELELSRIKYTLKELSFYNTNNINFFLPAGIKGKSDEEVRELIKKSFDKDKFEKAKRLITDYYEKIKENLSKTLNEVFYKDITDITVHLTSYGSGGSYCLPNIIVINIALGYDLTKTFVHEVVHLLFEPEVKIQKLSHKEKEEKVESLMKKLF